jgi:uncharacterized phage-associated protein
MRRKEVDMAERVESGFHKEKFKQVLHYLIFKCGSLENVGKTALFKLLYFSDFDYYELYEEKLTGESYRKLEHGPAASHFDDAVRELEAEGKIETTVALFGTFDQQKFLPVQKPSLDLLTANELQVIENDIAKYCSMNAHAFSHRDIPYKATAEGDIIDYELVFYRDALFSVREYEDDRVLAGR